MHLDLNTQIHTRILYNEQALRIDIRRGVLVQRNDRMSDPEAGGAYLLKKLVMKGGKACLRSINGNYPDVGIEGDGDIKIVAEYKAVLKS